MKTIYCSGPLFCPEECACMKTISDVLEQEGYRTFLPQRDGIEAYVLRAEKDQKISQHLFQQIKTSMSKAIFAFDIYQLIECSDGLVMNMNGRVPDEGAVAETAIAFAIGKPVVLYKNDHRSLLYGLDNSMLLGLASSFNYVTHFYDIPKAFACEFKHVKDKFPYQGNAIPFNVQKIVSYGRKISRFLDVIQFFKLKHEDEYLDRLQQLLNAFSSSELNDKEQNHNETS